MKPILAWIKVAKYARGYPVYISSTNFNVHHIQRTSDSKVLLMCVKLFKIVIHNTRRAKINSRFGFVTLK